MQVVNIHTENDLISARRLAREIAETVGFGLTDTTRLVTAASELARNIYQHARGGRMLCRSVEQARRRGVEMVFEDEGPGIADVDVAMQPGYSTGAVRSLGLGLSGTRRLVDEMDITSVVGTGTRITIRKWLTRTSRY